MTSLTKEEPSLTLIELYTQKQSKYTPVIAKKNATFKAVREAQDHAGFQSREAAKEHYDRWGQEHAHTWRNYVQAAYMDSVVSGKKEVESWS
jgi:hypothetical protein